LTWTSLFRRKPKLTPVERLIVREFPDAIEFASGEWVGFDRYVSHIMSEQTELPDLTKRFYGFINGPVFQELETRFPKIKQMAADMQSSVGGENAEVEICIAIAREALVSAGVDRAEVRKIGVN
jgi:hypothetical protein